MVYKTLSFTIFILCTQYLFATNFTPEQAAQLRQFRALDSLYEVYKEDNIKSAFDVSLQQEAIATHLATDSLRFKATFHKIASLLRFGFYDVALKISFDALKEAESQKDTLYEARFLNLIGQNYQDMGNDKQAKEFYVKAKEKLKLTRLKADTVFINYDLATCYFFLGDREKSLSILAENIKVAKTTQNARAIFLGLDNLAGYHANTYQITDNVAQLKKGLSYLEELLQYPNIWQSNYRKNLLYNHLAEYNKELKIWGKAQQYTDSSFKYVQKLETKDWLWNCYRVQSRIYEGKGDYKNALKYHRLYLESKDSIVRKNHDTKMAVMASLYDLEKKQTQINLLEQENKLKNSQRNGILLGALLTIVLLAAYFVLKQAREKSAMQRLFSQQLLQTQEAEKQRISKDLHDSIGQNILFIKNQLTKYNVNQSLDTVLTTVNHTIEEVRNVAKDLYPNQLEKYGLAAAVTTLAEKVTESTNVFVSADLADAEKLLNKESSIQLYRIMQEAINNTLKYAAATAIRITAEISDKQEITWLIQDNGKGFDKRILAQKQQRSFGLLGMEERVKLLGGSLNIETAEGKGTKLSFTIKSA